MKILNKKIVINRFLLSCLFALVVGMVGVVPALAATVSMSSTSGALSGGDLVEFTVTGGEQFSLVVPSSANNVVKFDNRDSSCFVYTIYRLRCTVPQGASAGLKTVSVAVSSATPSGIPWNATATYTYNNPPEIDSIGYNNVNPGYAELNGSYFDYEGLAFAVDNSNNVLQLTDIDVDAGVPPSGVVHIISGFDCSNTKFLYFKNVDGEESNQYPADCLSLGGTPAAGVPDITGLYPSIIWTTGGEITLLGLGFTGATSVKCGTNDADYFSVNNDTNLSLRCPAHAAGAVSVSVTTPLGIDTINQLWYVEEHFVTDFIPTTGSASGGTSVAILGTGLTNTFNLKFDNELATFTVVNDSQITATSPAHAAGTVNVTLEKWLPSDPNAPVKKTISTFTYEALPLPAPGPSIGNGTTCYDVRGMGKGIAVTPGNVNNSGVIDFEGAVPAQQYALCVQDPNDDGVAPFYLAGWAWDNNLGYISFYCQGGMNRGAPCGGVNYDGSDAENYGGVRIDADGSFHGYAWGDNVGWISFDNTPYAKLRLEVNDESCQGYVYGYTVPTAPGTGTPMNCNVTPRHGSSVTDGNKWTYVWADSVGWIDLDSTLFPWYTLVKKIVVDDIDPCFQLMTDGAKPAGNNCPGPIPPEPDPTIDPSGPPTPVPPPPRPSCPSDSSDSITNTSIVPSGIPKSGDGTDNYWQFKVKIKDRIDCNPITPDRYEVHAQFIWTDTVKTDQITPGMTLDNSNCSRSFSTDSLVAVKKDCGDVILNYNPTTKTYDAPPVYSLAPTSNANGVYLGGGLGFFPFEKFSLPPKTLVESSKLILHDIKLYVLDTHLQPTDPAYCVFPGPMASCTGQSLIGRNGFGGNYTFTFMPRTKITSIEQSTNGGLPNTMNMPVAVKVDFSSQVEGPGNITYFAGLEPFTSIFRMGFTSVDEFDYASLASSGTNGPFVGSKILSLGMSLNPAIVASGTAGQYSGGLYLYSEVSETVGSKSVRYYSNKLPRMVGSTGILPVAVLVGNVYSTGIATPTSTTAALRSLGDVSTNVLRDQIFKSVQKIIAGITVQPLSGTSSITSLDYYSDATKNTNDLKVLLDGKVLYSKGDVHLSSLSWTGEKTLIVIGGSVYLDKDLYPVTPAGQSRPRLGIISLKDITQPANTQFKAGNVYIDANVKNIQANIFADGSVFSYDKSKSPSVNTFGEPIFANIQEQNTLLRKTQLFIEGSVASQNTVGGADNSPMIKGDGTTATDRFQAQLYDFNYLRQYVGELRRDSSGNVCKGTEGLGTIASCSVINDASIQYLDSSGLPYSAAAGGVLYPPRGGTPANGLNPNKDLGSTYISFDPPPVTLPGFAFESGVETTFRVQ